MISLVVQKRVSEMDTLFSFMRTRSYSNERYLKFLNVA